MPPLAAPGPVRYAPAQVKVVVAQIAHASGVPQDDAKIFADALVEADVHGAATHGVSRLDIYIQRIQKGLIDPRAELRVERTRPAVLVADAGAGLGHVQAVKVLERMFPLAAEFGVATATIRNSNHFGALSYYCGLAAERDMILLAMTNCEPAMPPYGASEAFFGTNPIAASFPTGLDFPVKVDLATSIVARGNIIAAARRGDSIPPGWALDAAGTPTTDAGAALLGSVLTMAGHKGAALALLVEALAGVLSGAAVGSGVGSMYKDLDRPQNVGHFLCLLDISAFMDVETWRDRMGTMVGDMKGRRPLAGVDEILIPGERSTRSAGKNREVGIPLDPKTVEEIERFCDQLGLQPLQPIGADAPPSSP